jgi:hypothetical protein
MAHAGRGEVAGDARLIPLMGRRKIAGSTVTISMDDRRASTVAESSSPPAIDRNDNSSISSSSVTTSYWPAAGAGHAFERKEC